MSKKKENAMPELILHVGPGKCGSSSIQNFFATVKDPCIQKTQYALLNPTDISQLNCENPNESLLDVFAKKLSKSIAGGNTLILSHEFLFQNPYAIKNICCLAENLDIRVFVIGYSRRQSNFIISSYSQWLFRSPDRIGETTDTLKGFGLDPLLFTGLEKQFVASVLNDFYSARQLSQYSILDWYNAYNNISQLIPDLNVVIKCGVLPDKSSETSLIQDFCDKAGLTLHTRFKNEIQGAANRSFNQDVVEAMNNAVASGMDIAGPHDSNDIIELLSSQMSPETKNSSDFLTSLKSYADTYYWESNKKLCKQYGLDPAYFEASRRFSRQEITDIIIHENHQRSLNKSVIIENYRILSAKMVALCFKLAES